MSKIRGYAFLCDDIRIEADKRKSYMGVYHLTTGFNSDDRVEIPKIVAVFQVFYKKEDRPEKLSFLIKFINKDGSIEEVARAEAEDDNLQQFVTNSDVSAILNLSLSVNFADFSIEKINDRLSLTYIADGQEYELGSYRFVFKD